MNKTILSIMLILPMISLAQDSMNKGDKVQQRPTADQLRERLIVGVEKGRITQEQADKRYEADVRPDDKPDIETRYIRLGIDADELNRIQTKLMDSGITDNQLDLVLAAMIRMIHVAKNQGKEIDFSPRFQTYFENKVGLNDLQIQVVKGLSRRVARKL